MTPTMQPTEHPTPTATTAPVPTSAPTNIPARPLESSSLNILFIGSSHVLLYDLPEMLTKLVEARGYQVSTEMYAAPFLSLEDHAVDPQAFRMIGSQAWDYVVLQDDYRTVADRAQRELHTIPPALAFDNAIKFVGSRTIFFMTWGDPQPVRTGRLSKYFEQQHLIANGYWELSQRTGALVAPVGLAVAESLRQRPDLYLWLEDDIYGHANTVGTYLAACVFYALIYQESPEGLSYLVEPEEDALFLQSIAADTVLPLLGR